MGSQLALSNTGSEFGEFGVHRRLGLGLHRPIVANQSLANCELGAPRYNGYWLPRLCHGNSVEHTSRAKSGHASCRCDRIAPLCASFGSEYPQRGSGDEVALKVEGVVNRTVHAEKALADRADLNRCSLRSRRRTA